MSGKYSSVLTEKTVFTQKALSYEGYISQGIPLSLLSDDDIVSYIKNELHSTEEDRELRDQYFVREKRLKPLWKSESEFHQLEQDLIGSGVRRSFKAALKAISKTVFFMNPNEKDKVIKQIDVLKEAKKIQLKF